jgi:peptidase M50-like protein
MDGFIVSAPLLGPWAIRVPFSGSGLSGETSPPADATVMRALRYILRLILALEALGFLSLAFFTQKIVTARHLQLPPYAIPKVFCLVVLVSVVAAIAAWRIERRDALGRWSLLAASIFNLILFPVGLAVTAAGVFYFIRNPEIEPIPERKHRPIAGDGTSKLSGAIFLVAQVIWGVFVLSSIRRWTAARGMPQVHSETLFWITLACAIYGTVLFHELGHLVLGDIVRFRLMGFGVGPVSWVHFGGRWRLEMRFDKLLGGHTSMAPTTPRHIRGRAMIFTLGGPLASLTLGVIGSICLLLIPGPAWPAALGCTVALATGFSVGDFIFNLLPIASQAQYSDGARLLQMYRRGPWCDFHCANHYMALSQTTRLRPRDWPQEMVERAAEFAAQLPNPAGSFALAYAHFLDSGDWERALAWLDRARQTALPGTKLAHALAIDRAFIEGFHRRNSREAQRWFEQAPPRQESTDYWRALATLQAVHGDLAGAAATWNKAWAMAKTRPSTGVFDMDREQLQLVGRWIDQLRSQPIPA